MVDHLSGKFADAIKAAVMAWEETDVRWGRDDCLMALAKIVDGVTGKDTAKPYRGRYRSRNGAIRVLGKRGVPGALARAARALEWKRLNPASCRDGAIGYVLTPDGPAGVMRYGNMWVGRIDSGFAAYESGYVEKAWGY